MQHITINKNKRVPTVVIYPHNNYNTILSRLKFSGDQIRHLNRPLCIYVYIYDLFMQCSVFGIRFVGVTKQQHASFITIIRNSSSSSPSPSFTTHKELLGIRVNASDDREDVLLYVPDNRIIIMNRAMHLCMLLRRKQGVMLRNVFDNNDNDEDVAIVTLETNAEIIAVD